MTPLLYETSNIYVASYLICQGATLIETERVSARRTIFRFHSDEYLHAVLRVYWSNERVLIPPALLFTTLRKLKSRIRHKPMSRVAASDTANSQPVDGFAG